MLARRTATDDCRDSLNISQAGDFKAALNAAGDYVSDAAQSAKEAVVGKVRCGSEMHCAVLPWAFFLPTFSTTAHFQPLLM